MEQETEEFIPERYACLECRHNFSCRQNLYRHKKSHHGQERQRERQEEQLKIQNGNITGNNTTINTIGNNNTIGNIITNNIIIEFGHESIDCLTQNEILSILDAGFKCYEKLLELLHMSDNHKENHNIFFTNERSNTFKIYKGNHFLIENKNVVFENLIRKSCDFLNEMYESKVEIYKTKATRMQQLRLDNVKETIEKMEDFLTEPELKENRDYIKDKKKYTEKQLHNLWIIKGKPKLL